MKQLRKQTWDAYFVAFTEEAVTKTQSGSGGVAPPVERRAEQNRRHCAVSVSCDSSPQTLRNALKVTVREKVCVVPFPFPSLGYTTLTPPAPAGTRRNDPPPPRPGTAQPRRPEQSARCGRAGGGGHVGGGGEQRRAARGPHPRPGRQGALCRRRPDNEPRPVAPRAPPPLIEPNAPLSRRPLPHDARASPAGHRGRCPQPAGPAVPRRAPAPTEPDGAAPPPLRRRHRRRRPPPAARRTRTTPADCAGCAVRPRPEGLHCAGAAGSGRGLALLTWPQGGRGRTEFCRAWRATGQGLVGDRAEPGAAHLEQGVLRRSRYRRDEARHLGNGVRGQSRAIHRGPASHADSSVARTRTAPAHCPTWRMGGLGGLCKT
ncbi:uncharacterized protein LOC141571257 [Rhinolophus sinicus]|uniref:uncharacterized protein LOC141571257 n=1 Tax=Rhinolophus sinicus TaxID=89399 RepID=UPI003D79FEFF